MNDTKWKNRLDEALNVVMVAIVLALVVIAVLTSLQFGHL